MGSLDLYLEDYPCLSLTWGFLANSRTEETWKFVISKFPKLSMWKHKTLSLAGRVCLINLVFTSLPLFLCLFLKCLSVL